MDDKIKKAYERYMNDTTNQNNALQYAKALVYSHDYDKALEIFSKIEDEFLQKEVKYYVATVYRYQKKYNEAENLLNSLLETDYYGRCMYELAQINIERLKTLKRLKSDKIDDLNKTIIEQLYASVSAKPTFRAYLCLGNQYYYEKNYDKAIECYENSLKTNEKNINDNYYVKIRLIESYLYLNDTTKAKELLTGLVNEKYKNTANINRLYSKIYIKEKNYNLAKESISKLDDQSFEVYFDYAKLCMSKQFFDEASIYFKKCLNGFNKPQALHQLAKINFNLGNISESKKFYNQMLLGNAMDKNIGNIGLGMCERIEGNYSLALEFFDKVNMNNIRDKVQVLIEKGKVYRLMGDLEKTEYYFNEAVKLDYNDFGKLEYAKFKISMFEGKEARKLLMEIINSNSPDREIATIILAKLELMEKNTEIGLNTLKGFTETSEVYYEAIIELLNYYIETDKIEIIEYYLDILANSHKNIDGLNFNYYKGLLERKKKNFDLSISYLNKCLNSLRKEKILSELIDIYYYELNDEKKAMEYLEILKNCSNIGNKYYKFLYGKICLEKNDIETGLAYLRDSTEQGNIKSVEAIELLAQYEEEEENYEKALEYYYKLPEKYYLSNWAFKMIDLCLKLNRSDEAKEVLGKLKDNSIDVNNHILLRLGIVEYSQGNYDEALKILNNLKNTDVEEFALLQISKIYSKLGDTEKSEEILNDLLNTSNRTYALMELIILNYNKSDIKNTFNYIEKLIIEGNETDIMMANYYKAKMYAKTGNKNKAKKILSEILFDENGERKNSIKPSEYNKFLLELAHIERDLGNVYKAEEYYKSVKKTNKNWPYAMRELIELKLNKRNFEEAEELIKELEENSYTYFADMEKARLFLASGKFNEAIAKFDKIEPFNEEVKYNKAICYINMGDLASAKEIFMSLQNSLEYAELTSYNLGVLSKYDKDNINARKYFEKTSHYNMNALLDLIMLDIEEEKYLDALNKLNKLYQSDSYKEACTIIYMLLSQKLNILFDEEYYGHDNYTKRQIVEYNEESAKNHIKKHFRLNESKRKDGIFNENIDIDLLFDHVKVILTEDNLVEKGIMDFYIIPFENIGGNGESYLRIVTLPGTKDIIAMYPCFEKYKEFTEEAKRI